MASEINGTPFQTGATVKTFADRKMNKLLIRVESGGTFKVAITLNGTDPSASNAAIFLDSGEAIDIDEKYYGIGNGSKVRVLSLVGDPLIYWHLH